MVSEEGLQALNAGCPALQGMDVANCQMVSEKGLQALNASCPGLQRMDVANYQMVSVEGLQALSAVCWFAALRRCDLPDGQQACV